MLAIDNLLKEYKNTFGDAFPTMCFQDESWGSICSRIEQCLKQGKPAEEVFSLDYADSKKMY